MYLEPGNGGPPSAPHYFFAASDSRYFNMFGPALVMSAVQTNNPLHLHIANPTDQDYLLAGRLCGLAPFITITWSYHPGWQFKSGVEQLVEFASLRFHVLPELLRLPTTVQVFTIDIDSILNQYFPFSPDINKPLGLFLRDPVAHGANSEIEMKGMRCLGCMYAHTSIVDYADEVSAYIKAHERRWFIDQEALYETYESQGMQKKTFDLSVGPYIDWAFKPDTILWTGKGPRKYADKVYVARYNSLMQAFKDQFAVAA